MRGRMRGPEGTRSPYLADDRLNGKESPLMKARMKRAEPGKRESTSKYDRPGEADR